MKRIVLLIISLLCLQSNSQNETKLGLKAGANYFVGKTSNDKPGYFVGGLINRTISQDFDIQMEMLFYKFNKSSKDEKYDVITPPGVYAFATGAPELNISQTTFQVPIILQYKASSEIFSEFGVYGGYIFSKSAEFVEYPFGNETNYPVEINEFDELDYGLVIGAGYKISSAMRLSARFSYGLKEKDELANVGLNYMF